MSNKVEKTTATVPVKRKFLDKVMKNLKRCVEAEDHNRTAAIEDLKFLNGDQWDEDEKKRRKKRKRPMLTINMLPDKVDKVVGDMRQNGAKIKVRPASPDANPELARIREGKIMDIEYESNASAIYGYAGGRMVECGEGAWRILTRKCEGNPFIQEIYLKLVKNSFLIYMDPDAEDPMGADAKYGFVLTKMKKEQFEDEWPKAQIPGDSMKFGPGLASQHWYDKAADTVTIAEYFEVRKKTKTMCLMQDGKVLEKPEAEKRIKSWQEKYGKAVMSQQLGAPPSNGVVPPPPTPNPPGGAPLSAEGHPVVPAMTLPQGVSQAPQQTTAVPAGPTGVPGTTPMPNALSPQGGLGVNPMPSGLLPPPKPKILKEADTEVREVRVWKVTACDILEGEKEGKKFPGKYIPLVKVKGKERNVEGKDFTRGLIRDAKDPQRLVNYWKTSTAESIALAPKSPWVGTATMFEGYEEDYANANVDNIPFLKFNPDPDFPGVFPKRQGPGEAPVALFTQQQSAERDLNTVVSTGPDYRDVAPDASAKSLIQRQKPHELITFPFVDNLAQAQLHTYKIINEMIPEVYDTARDTVVRYEDGTETYVPINMTAEEALKAIIANPDRYKGMDAARLQHAILTNGGDSRFNDMSVGTFKLQMDLGPPFATQRQETADKFVLLAQTNPKLWNIAGDLIVESLDVNKANELAERIKKTLPPGLVKKKPGEPPTEPMPPTPQAQMAKAKITTEQMKAKKEMIKQQVELVKLKTEMIKQYKETKETDKEIRREIIKALMELHGPSHPADEQTALQAMEAMGTENNLGG